VGFLFWLITRYHNGGYRPCNGKRCLKFKDIISVSDFEEFLKRVKQGEVVKERDLALKWISEIKDQVAEAGTSL
jgi:hypothetical protein